MISALTLGELFADPVQRTTGAGKPYATATVRSGNGSESILIGLSAFSATAIQKLMQLRKADTVTATGTFEQRECAIACWKSASLSVTGCVRALPLIPPAHSRALDSAQWRMPETAHLRSRTPMTPRQLLHLLEHNDGRKTIKEGCNVGWNGVQAFEAKRLWNETTEDNQATRFSGVPLQWNRTEPQTVPFHTHPYGLESGTFADRSR